MAYISGTAPNWQDFYNTLRDFLTTGMTPVGERWTQVSGPVGVLTAADEIVLRGPGLAGADEVLVGIKPFTSVGADYYNLAFYGLSIFNGTLGPISSQVNRSEAAVLHLWKDPIDYWIVANGRRFMIVCRISTVYFAAYCGFALPLTLPSQYPYPLFVGAASNDTTTRWSGTTPNMRNFFSPAEGANLMMPDVTWRKVQNWSSSQETQLTSPTGLQHNPWYWDVQPIRENIDGSYSLLPSTIVGTSPHAAQYARLQGVYRVSGFGNSAGSIVTHNGVPHIVVPNVFRSDWQNFAALALE